MTKLKNPWVWVWSLGAAVIGGAATAGISWFGMLGANAAGLNVPVLNWQSLGIICLSGGLTSALGYLKQSPLPTMVEEETTITTRTVIKKDEASPP